MTSNQEFAEYVMEQVQGAGAMRMRQMFGGCTLYCNDKVVALILYNQVFVKPTDAGREFIGEPLEAPAYPGAKPSFLIEQQVEDREWFSGLIHVTQAALPKPKPRKKKATKKEARRGDN